MGVELEGEEIAFSVDFEPKFKSEELDEMWNERSDAMDKTIGVALSGGGYRATLLSLGVLTYLVDSGLNDRVRTISSVSGGSYANALVATQQKSFHAIQSQEDRDVFYRGLCAVIDRLTSTNIWLKPRVLGLGFSALAIFAIPRVLARLVWRGALGRFLVRLAGWLGALWILKKRGDVLSREIWRTLFGSDGRDEVMGSLHQDREDGDSLDHIICATNIANGRFVYFSGRFLYASELGWQTDASPLDHLRPATNIRAKARRRMMTRRWCEYRHYTQIPIKSAVDASAALPIVIPPRRFPTGVFERAGMWFVPDELRLVDGGVYDNLAVQWFRSADSMKNRARKSIQNMEDDMSDIFEPADLKTYMDNMAPPWIFRPDLLLVVNAGGELKWTRHLPFTTMPILREPIPIMTETAELARTAKIAFTSGTERRLYWLRREFRKRFLSEHPKEGEPEPMASSLQPVEDWRGTIVQIDHSPYRVPNALREYGNEEVEKRARHARKILGRLGRDWTEIKEKNAGIPAYPRKMKIEAVHRLMYHGYVSAWANLYSLWGLGEEQPISYEEFQKRFECGER